MLPHVFVSSTIEDLHHLRDAIRDAIIDLSYQPVMSEYGDIGYLSNRSAAESCYLTVRECQIAVLILGKRYGTVGADGKSITHNEFAAARDHRMPTICLVDREVLSYKKIHDANGGQLRMPGMEAAEKTFQLIDEISRSANNNAVLAFGSVHEAKALVKSQIAHMVGDLLRRDQDPIAANLRELMAELKTVRHEIATGTRAPHFMRAARFLLNEDNVEYSEIVESLFGSIENGIPILLDTQLFDEVLAKATNRVPVKLAIATWAECDAWVASHERELRYYAMYGASDAPEERTSLFAVTVIDPQTYINELMSAEGQAWHSALLAFSTGTETSPPPDEPTQEMPPE